MKKFLTIESYILLWLPLAAAIILLSGVSYILVQQSLRQGANDPQIQIAEDAGARLTEGRLPQAVVPAQKVDMAKSLTPFVIVYDDRGNVLASSVTLNGTTPTLPKGVLDSAREQREDRITWQPQPGVRAAAVIERYTGKTPGFVLVGRSLREVEKRVDAALGMALLGLSGTLAVSFVILYFVKFSETS